jgi:hypothetical protein
MTRKRQEYSTAGAALVWQAHPQARTGARFTPPDPPDAVLTAGQTLDGGAVRPASPWPWRTCLPNWSATADPRRRTAVAPLKNGRAPAVVPARPTS